MIRLYMEEILKVTLMNTKLKMIFIKRVFQIMKILVFVKLIIKEIIKIYL